LDDKAVIGNWIPIASKVLVFKIRLVLLKLRKTRELNYMDFSGGVALITGAGSALGIGFYHGSVVGAR
jgi:hypothetical protein